MVIYMAFALFRLPARGKIIMQVTAILTRGGEMSKESIKFRIINESGIKVYKGKLNPEVKPAKEHTDECRYQMTAGYEIVEECNCEGEK